MTTSNDESLIEMFRAEVETHLATLSDGLLALERDPSQHHRFPALMRAAHSIKGAAKIVGKVGVVRVAHEMESCFVALNEGQVVLSSRLVDSLLKGIDLLETASVPESHEADLRFRIDGFVADVARSRAGDAEDPSIDTGPKPERDGGRSTELARKLIRPPAHLDRQWVKDHWLELSPSSQLSHELMQLDFCDVTSLDADGVRWLAALKRAHAMNRVPGQVLIQIENASPRIRQFLLVTGLSMDGTPGLEGV